jgi:hypothetical protein
VEPQKKPPAVDPPAMPLGIRATHHISGIKTDGPLSTKIKVESLSQTRFPSRVQAAGKSQNWKSSEAVQLPDSLDTFLCYETTILHRSCPISVEDGLEVIQK